MSVFQDCSAAAQYASIGAAMRREAAPARPEPRPMSGLEALGRRVGAADAAPRAPEVVATSRLREPAWG